MKPSRRLLLAAMVLLGTEVGAGASVPAQKTLTRFHDPVVVGTSRLAGLTDHATAHYRLYAAQAGVIEPIPFQFDARDADGDLVLPKTPAEAEFTFDEDDELVFMAKDTGDRVAQTDLPRASDAALELEVTDPVDGGQGWAYLVHFLDHPPPRSPVTYVTFDAEKNEARAQFYRVTYFPGRNFFTELRITPAGGGAGENLLNRMRVRINPTFSLLLTTWSPAFTEESFSVTIDGIKNGPVRAVRRVRQTLDLGKFFPEVPSGTVYTYYYFSSSFTTPSTFSVPWVVLKALRDFRFEDVDDFGDKAASMQYWDGANPRGLRFAGDARVPVTDRDHDWWAASGPAGTCLHAFIVPEEWRRWGIVRGTVFRDGDGDTDGFGELQGTHAAGFSLQRMTNLREPGAYRMNLGVFILPRHYRPGDEAQPLAMLTWPLRVQAAPVE